MLDLFCIALPQIHRQFRIGPPKIHRRFRIGPPQVTLNILLPVSTVRGIFGIGATIRKFRDIQCLPKA